MKVILKQAVPKLGKTGQVVNVKEGYARNFLFPQGMATVADKSQLQVLERRNAKIQKALDETKSSAEAMAEKLNGKHIKYETKAGSDKARLFGAVTSQDIADLIKKELKETVDKKDILLLRPIKRLGTYDIEIDIHRNVDIVLKLEVFDPEVVLEEEATAVEELVEQEAEMPVANPEETQPEAQADTPTDDEAEPASSDESSDEESE